MINKESEQGKDRSRNKLQNESFNTQPIQAGIMTDSFYCVETPFIYMDEVCIDFGVSSLKTYVAPSQVIIKT